MAKKGRVFSSHMLKSMQGVTTQPCIKPTQCCYIQSFLPLVKWVYSVEVGKMVFTCFPIKVAAFGRIEIRIKVFSLQL